jgi:hypothetical protein
MSAALKSYVPRPLPSQRRPATTRATLRSNAVALPVDEQPQISPPVALPTPSQLGAPSPAVRVLSHLNLVASALSLSLVTLTLISYGTSVYLNRQLSQANQYLNRLQRSEQQLTTANEVLKNHLAQQAGLASLGFQPPQPGSVIFLKPAHQTVPGAADHPTETSLPKEMAERFTLPRVDVPLGY